MTHYSVCILGSPNPPPIYPKSLCYGSTSRHPSVHGALNKAALPNTERTSKRAQTPGPRHPGSPDAAWRESPAAKLHPELWVGISEARGWRIWPTTPGNRGSERTVRNPGKTCRPPLTTRWAPAARPRADADAGRSLSSLKAIAPPSPPAQGPDGRERDGVLGCLRRASMTSPPRCSRRLSEKNNLLEVNRRLGQVIPEGLRLSLDLHYGQGVSSFGRVARLNPQTIDLRMWRKARRPSWALPIAWRLPTLSWGSRKCLEGCDESVTLRVLWGGSARSPDPVVRTRHPDPRPTSED